MKHLLAVILTVVASAASAETRIGLIGLDTGHVVKFTKFINVDRDPAADGFRVVSACPRGSRDIFSSTNRIPKFVKQVAEMGVEIVQSVDELLAKVDCVCLETNDGREHLWQAEKVFKAGKRVFIDKPLAHRYLEAERICTLAKQYDAKFFSASALRYVAVAKAAHDGAYGPIASATIVSPDPVEEQGTHNDYAWYGIHGFDPLVAIMGRGVETVSCLRNGSNDVVNAVWRDGRMAQLYLQREGDWHTGYILPARPKDDRHPAIVFDDYRGYAPLLREILAFFRTGVAPVPPEETLEIMAFMEAAQLSARRGGEPVTLVEACELARASSGPELAFATVGRTCDSVRITGYDVGNLEVARKVGGEWLGEKPVVVEPTTRGFIYRFEKQRYAQAVRVTGGGARTSVDTVEVLDTSVAEAKGRVAGPIADWCPGKVGVITHYLPEDVDFNNVDRIDAKALVTQLKEMHADYYFLTISQNNGFYVTPNETLEKLAGLGANTRCTKRDLPGDIIAALKGTGIRFGLYLPCQPCRNDRPVVEGVGLEMGTGPNAPFRNHPISLAAAQNWAKVIETWSVRYGKDVSLWWFDGAYRYLGFDAQKAALYRSAAKKGNPDALVTFNPGVRKRNASESQCDYWAGEENYPLSVVPTSRWTHNGLQWHVITWLGDTWGAGGVRFPDAWLRDWFETVTTRGGMVTLDVSIDYATGHLDRAQREQFRRVREEMGR